MSPRRASFVGVGPIALAIASLLGPGRAARADEAQPAPAATAEGAERPVSGRKDLVWQPAWGHAHPVEYGVAVTFGALTVAGHLTPVRDAAWSGNEVDDAVRDVFRIEEHGPRKATRTVGDVLFYSIMAYPVIVDTVLVAGPRNGEVAWQMLVMSSQSLALGAFTSVTLEHSTGRERPYVRECRRGTAGYEDECAAGETEQNQSFLSGHTLMAFTGAGLICAHHTHLPLYGGGIADGAACALGLTGASIQAATRLTADRHYLSDVMVGSALGFGFGYALPMLLHYGRATPAASAPAIVPYAAGSHAGLIALGSF